jgi:FkbM family methyltransferase
MGQVSDQIKKIFQKARSYITRESRELRRLQALARYTPGHTHLLGNSFEYADVASFIGQYLTIIKSEMYDFRASSQNPYIVDCGANIGVSIAYYKKKYPDAEILAFEPDKKIFSILERNVRNAGFTNVTLVNKGIWNQHGKIQFLVDGADGGSILKNDLDFVGDSFIAEIETTCLKDYLVRKVDFLKIDIEGAESVVIEDCQDVLQQVEYLFIEHHGNRCEKQKLDRTLQVLAKNGFRYYIESAVISNPSPFIDRMIIKNFDNFLNIYAYRQVTV